MKVWMALGLLVWGVVFLAFWVALIRHKLRVARRWPLVLAVVETAGHDAFGAPTRNIRLPTGSLAVLKLAEGAPEYELPVGKKLRVHMHPEGKPLCERPISRAAWIGMGASAVLAYLFGAAVIIIALKAYAPG